MLEKAKPHIKWIVYYLLLLVFLALQTTPELFKVVTIKPVLIAPLIICVCMFEDVFLSGIYAMVGGLFWDVTSQKLLGFNSVLFICMGVLVSLLCVYYLHSKLINGVFFTAGLMILQGLYDYFFHYTVWSIENSSVILLYHILPTAIYTIILCIPIYYIVRMISQSLGSPNRI